MSTDRKSEVNIKVNETELELLRNLIQHEKEILEVLNPHTKQRPKFRIAIELISSLETKLDI